VVTTHITASSSINHSATPQVFTLSLHDALPIYQGGCGGASMSPDVTLLQRTLSGYARHPNFAGILVVGLGCEANQIPDFMARERSEEHTSELQSRENLVCRLLLEKKKQNNISTE